MGRTGDSPLAISSANCAMTFAERKDWFEGYGDGVVYVPFSLVSLASRPAESYA